MAQRDLTTRHYDKRLMERYVTRGVLSQAEVDKHLEGLADKAEEAENIAELVYAGSEAQADEAPADAEQQ